MVQGLPYGWHHGRNECVVNVGGALVSGVLGVGQVVDRRTVKDHVVDETGVAVDPTDVVVELDPVVQLGGGVPEEDLIGAMQSQCSERLFLPPESRELRDPVIDDRRLPYRVASRDGDAHSYPEFTATPPTKLVRGEREEREERD